MSKEKSQKLSSDLGPRHGEGLPTWEQAAAAVRIVKAVYEEAGAVDFRVLSIGDACTVNATPQSDIDVAVDNLGDYAERGELRCEAKTRAEEATGRSIDVLTFRDPQYYLNTDLNKESISE